MQVRASVVTWRTVISPLRYLPHPCYLQLEGDGALVLSGKTAECKQGFSLQLPSPVLGRSLSVSQAPAHQAHPFMISHIRILVQNIDQILGWL
jgi:hypothetical protein